MRLLRLYIAILIYSTVTILISFWGDILSLLFSSAHRSEAESTLDTDPDADCIFRNSSLYRKIFVYPGPGLKGWEGGIFSEYGRKNSSVVPWPWLAEENRMRTNVESILNPESTEAQFATELLVREIMTHPQSCLRTFDPEEAELFYIPYSLSVEFHSKGPKSRHQTSPWAQAIVDAINGNYEGWEQQWGLTSKYWRRRNGADHLLVQSNPVTGLTHPRHKSGSFHYLYSQHQLAPPIVISIELSTTFVNMHPKCAAKNILMPYPVINGNYYNGRLTEQVKEVLRNASLLHNRTKWRAALPAEHRLDKMGAGQFRPFAQYYKAGVHGSCVPLRRAMKKDFKCSKSFQGLSEIGMRFQYPLGMRMSTFCPCSGGDTPSAKRMFDAVLAGCIPVVISHDFVWPFTNEFEPLEHLNPSDFSIRLPGDKFYDVKYNNRCMLRNASDPSMQMILEAISPEEIKRLRAGVSKAADMYAYYRKRNDFPYNPVSEGVLPDGGAAHALVRALEQRAGGVRWPDCEMELKKMLQGSDPETFKC